MEPTNPSARIFEGPALDRLFPIRLAGGRMVSVKEFSVLPSYSGLQEGWLDSRMTASKREMILAVARRRYGDPVVAVEPTIVPHERALERLPWMACIAYLTSAPLDPEKDASELALVWWQDAFTEVLPKEIERVAAGVDWESCAKDVGPW